MNDFRNRLPRFRWLRNPIPFKVLDDHFGNFDQWVSIRDKIKQGDKIWPFRIPRRKKVFGHREGYVVLRKGQFVCGVVTISS